MKKERVTWISPEQGPDHGLALSKRTEREGIYSRWLPAVRRMILYGMEPRQETERRFLGISA